MAVVADPRGVGCVLDNQGLALSLKHMALLARNRSFPQQITTADCLDIRPCNQRADPTQVIP